MICTKKERLNRSRMRGRRDFILSAYIIVKNEAPYILEWIAYHRVVGFDFFYIYDNDSTDRLRELLMPLVLKGICCVISWPRSQHPSNPQVAAYRHAQKNFGHESEWVVTIDADEFVVPLTSDNVSTILKQHFSERDAVLCNWRVFGSAGHLVKSPELCIERFHRASHPNFISNKNVKSFFRPSSIEAIFVHNHWVKSDNIALSDNSDFITPREQLTTTPIFGHFQINHYFCKSMTEFLNKRLKGLADHPSDAPYAIRAMEMFEQADRNECLEQSIFKFIYKTKSEIEHLRRL